MVSEVGAKVSFLVLPHRAFKNAGKAFAIDMAATATTMIDARSETKDEKGS
jgi:hypothetical protein